MSYLGGIKRSSLSAAIGSSIVVAIYVGWLLARNLTPDEHFFTLYRLVIAALLATWLVADTREAGRSQPTFDYGAYFVFALVLFAPYYVIATRRSCTATQSADTISDSALLRYDSQDYDQAQLMFKRLVLGKNNGITVVAEFPCSDLCPQGTVRVIHYDVPLSMCSAIGGVEKEILYGFIVQKFCLPKILAASKQ
jgi:hypothetical protein